MPPRMPSRRLVVLRAICSPSGHADHDVHAEPAGRRPRRTAAVIIRAGHRVDRRAADLQAEPRLGHRADAVAAAQLDARGRSAPARRWRSGGRRAVTSGSSPASLTTTARSPSPSRRAHRTATAKPYAGAGRQRDLDVGPGTSPVEQGDAAALAAAAAHAPVDNPAGAAPCGGPSRCAAGRARAARARPGARRPRRRARRGRPGPPAPAASGSIGSVTAQSPAGCPPPAQRARAAGSGLRKLWKCPGW